MQENLKHYSDKLRERESVSSQFEWGSTTARVAVHTIKTYEEHTENVPIGNSISPAEPMRALAQIGSIAAVALICFVTSEVRVCMKKTQLAKLEAATCKNKETRFNDKVKRFCIWNFTNSAERF